MKKAGGKLFFITAILFPLITGLLTYIIYINSFYMGALLSEEASVNLTYYTMITGGMLGVLSSFFSLYFIFRNKRISGVFARTIILFPFIVLSCIFIYGFLVLKNIF